MMDLHSALQRYVATRRDLGYKFKYQERLLASYVRFMAERGLSVITNKVALEWASLPPTGHGFWAARLTAVRGFAQYLRCFDERTEVPPPGIFRGPRRAKPYLYTDAEIGRLLTEALALSPQDGLRRWTYHCLFGLLATTGLRISEALQLCCKDVDLEHGVLTIRMTKFGKSRLVPLHRTTCQAMVHYASRRDSRFRRRRSPYFFVAERGGRLLPSYVYKIFWKLSRQTGLRRPTDHTGPRIHDLRHRFAVNTLLYWYRSGQNVDRMLPVLSTYLGHTCVRDTYWYLSACPELLEHAVRRLEEYWHGGGLQ